jgi:Xaa-Pro aminopeptidase
LRRIIDDELYRHGCLGVETIVACGLEAADPHCKGYGELKAGEPIVMDVFPRSLETLYFADMTRTVFKGEPGAAIKKMYEAVLKAQEDTIAMIRPGVDGSELDKKAREILDAAGFPTTTNERPMRGFIHSLGHGVGLEIHETPSLSPRRDVLREGNVVTNEPGLYYPIASGEIPAGGIRIEDMILITKEGYRNLTEFPKRLEEMIIS